MSSERERRYLAHIAESITLIDDCVRGARAAFFQQPQVQDAVLRRLEIPDIPWREVYDFRNIAAHAYLDIDLERASGRS